MDYQGGGSWHGGRGHRGRGRGGRSSTGDGSGWSQSEQNTWQLAGGSGYGGSRGAHRGGYDGGRGGSGSGSPPTNRGDHSGGGAGERWGAPPPSRRGYEGGRGGGRGPPAPRHPPSSGSSSGPLALQLAKLQTSPTLEIVDGQRVPMQCPDNGGTLGNHSLNLLVNHFQLNFDRTFSVLHYEIDITLENNSQPSADTKISKSDLVAIKQHLFKDRASSLPDDGGRNIFSPVKLQEGKYLVKAHGTSYCVSVVLQKRLSIGDLANTPLPREILQGLDVIMRMNSARHCLQKGSNFFMPNMPTNLGCGASALEGFKQSLKPTENGLIACIDYSVMAFQKPLPVIDFLMELGFQINEHGQLSGRDRADVEHTLKNMRVTVTHRRSRQKFEVQGLTQKSTCNITFFDESSKRQRSLLDYYWETYQIDIRYKRLPCLSLSKTKTNYVPMELCKIIEGQLIPKEKLHKKANDILKNMAIVQPWKRMNAILKMVNNNEAGPCRGKILDEFHLTVSRDMTNVTARVLERPALKLLSASGNATKFDVSNNDCQWNLLNNKVLRGKQIDYWAILDLSRWQQSRRREEVFDVRGFIHELVKRCWDLGIPMNGTPLFVEQQDIDVLFDSDGLRQVLQSCKRKGGNRLQLLVCPMAGKHDGYKILKYICETEMGFVTQCLLPSNMKNKKDQYLANLALKINAKLGGSNFELFESLPGMVPTCPILFIGADVNHPSARNTTSPSIVAVVASTNWPALNNYASIVQAQKHRKENIIDIGRMCRQLLDKFSQANPVRPGHIIYFRDGVSDSQFDMVLNQELTEIKLAIESAHYKPKITVVVAQKRHQTRLFPKDGRDPLSTRSGNVPPGTVVDKGIISPISFNFYLCSHNGLRGTSKPTHYYVLWDEFGYTSDGIQQLIYNLCFTFARCTKPVSLVPPVYYADLLAYRGRIYYEAMVDISSSASRSLASSSSAYSETVKLPELHVSIKNGMFFL